MTGSSVVVAVLASVVASVEVVTGSCVVVGVLASVHDSVDAVLVVATVGATDNVGSDEVVEGTAPKASKMIASIAATELSIIAPGSTA